VYAKLKAYIRAFENFKKSCRFELLLNQSEQMVIHGEDAFRKNLVRYIGEAAAHFIDENTKGLTFHLKVTKERATKYGDYSTPINNKKQQITVNGNLDQFSFLLTLLHELAHLRVYEKHSYRIKPHGEQWKNEFANYLRLAIEHHLFPEEIAKPIRKYYISKLSFTHNSRVHVLNSILNFLKKEIPMRLQDIPLNSKAILSNGMMITKIEQKRTRCICKDHSNNKLYSIHKSIEVLEIISQ
jgi:N-glycosylase/DNA lyase